MTEKTVRVPGINCSHCVRTIERELSELNGVTSVKADADNKQVFVRWQGELVGWDEIQALLKEIGYPPES